MTLEMRDLARAMSVAQPALADGTTLDWSVMRTALVSFYSATGFGPSIAPQGSDQERARQTAIEDYYVRNNATAARAAWQRQGDGPRDPVELAMVAGVEANAGLDTALPYIEQIRAYEPAEADAMLAVLRLRQSRTEDAATALESALRQMADDPWPLQNIKEGAIALAGTLGGQSPAMARRMIAALARPFAAGALLELRATTAALLSRTAGLAGSCVEPVSALEPYAPWDRQFLLLRRECYQAVGDARLAVAERDLADFAQLETQPFAIGPLATP